MNNTSSLSPNSLSFIALCNEFCQALERAREADRETFVCTMLRLLPRIYISATDLRIDDADEESAYIESVLDEDYYEAIRRNVEFLLGPDDTYLEVFEEDMKYSDTPIAASVSEQLADIMQVCYNFVETIKDAPDEVIVNALYAVKEDFQTYWSSKLCNVLRPLNQIRYNSTEI
ncbi:MAG: DUF5063 domain-containing protein [Paramuribaculum sp.]|nr:DUF5063 domain-containing protein [Paramuribaculum sp.]